MADPETDPAPSGRDMTQPYEGPERGPGIAAHGRTADGGLRAAMGFAEMIVDTVREGLLVLDLDLRVQAANESFYRMFEATRDETEGRLVYELGGGVWDRPELRGLLERVLPERHVFDDFEVEHGEGEGRRVHHLNGRQLNHHHMVLLAVSDGPLLWRRHYDFRMAHAGAADAPRFWSCGQITRRLPVDNARFWPELYAPDAGPAPAAVARRAGVVERPRGLP